MAVVRDQASGLFQVGNGASLTVTWPVNPRAGSKVLLFVQANGTVALTDNGAGTNTWVQDVNTTSGKGASVWRADNISLPTSGTLAVTITWSPSSTGTIDAWGCSYLNVKPGAPTATNTGSGTGTSVSSGAAAPANPGGVVFGGFSDGSSLNPETISFTGSSPLTSQFIVNNGSGFWPCGAADGLNAVSQTLTWTLGDSVAWGAVIAAYDAADWALVGTVNTDNTNGTTTQAISLPSGVKAGDFIAVALCYTTGTGPCSVSVPGFTTLQSFRGGAKGTTSAFSDNFWVGYRIAAGTTGQATTDTSFTATFNGTGWSESVTGVWRAADGFGSVIASAVYNGNASGVYSTTCPDPTYTVKTPGNLMVWGYGGMNSAESGTETFSGTGPSALANFVQNTLSGNGGAVGMGWGTGSSAPGGATSSVAVDAMDFVIEVSENVVQYDVAGPAGTPSAGVHGTTSPLSWTHVLSAAATGVLVCVVNAGSGTNNVTSVTIGASNTNIPLLGTSVSSQGTFSAWYGLIAPPTGSQTVKVNFSGSPSDMLAGSVSFVNAGSFGSVFTANNGAGSTSSQTDSVTSTTVGGIVAETCSFGGQGWSAFTTTGSGGTIRLSDPNSSTFAGDMNAIGTYLSTGQAMTVGFSAGAGGADCWTVAAVEVLPPVTVVGYIGQVLLDASPGFPPPGEFSPGYLVQNDPPLQVTPWIAVPRSSWR